MSLAARFPVAYEQRDHGQDNQEHEWVSVHFVLSAARCDRNGGRRASRLVEY
jgi:hypothetical protein